MYHLHAWTEIHKWWMQAREVSRAQCCYAAGLRTCTFEISCNPQPRVGNATNAELKPRGLCFRLLNAAPPEKPQPLTLVTSTPPLCTFFKINIFLIIPIFLSYYFPLITKGKMALKQQKIIINHK